MEDHRLQARPPRRRGLIRTPACCWQGANQRKKKWTLQRLATASLSDGIRPTTCSNMQVPVPSKWENVDGFLHFSKLVFPSKWSDCLCKPAFCPPKRPTPPPLPPRLCDIDSSSFFPWDACDAIDRELSSNTWRYNKASQKTWHMEF